MKIIWYFRPKGLLLMGKIRPCVVVTNDIYTERVPVIQVVPLTGWSEKKEWIKANIIIEPAKEYGLIKKSVADCLQTWPIDHRFRMVRLRGELSKGTWGRLMGP